MYIENLPQSLVELAKAKLEENKEKTVEESKKEKIVLNPVIDSPHSVRNQ